MPVMPIRAPTMIAAIFPALMMTPNLSGRVDSGKGLSSLFHVGAYDVSITP
jgi:hypothetical protein